jgi:hypothetical protein
MDKDPRMRKSYLSSLARIAASSAIVAMSTLSFAAAPASDDQAAIAKFSVAQRTEVPGLTLQPGSYSIKVVDHLSDRYILRVDGANGSVHSTFIGLPNSTIRKGNTSGLINWDAGPVGQKAVRGYAFPGGTTVQFVYPKAEAVSLAKVNDSKVPAIDPASEGKVEANNLSKDDMEIVTLWMLSSTQVGPTDSAPEIKAERYQASASTPPAPHKTVIAVLPHTASFMPILFCIAIFSLVTATALRFFRFVATRS